ncbi:MAG: carboxymuconolactone decarboxylase family protein [Planctomycetes bacterium]|nr:carboxymuconolactone decarboxylase family protein [Planctomycetota bacterium]
MSDPLHAAFALAAAVQASDTEAMCAAAKLIEEQYGAGSCRETLRQLHLYFGFPRIVQALNACAPALAEPDEGDQSTPSPTEPRAIGEAVFRELYAEDADKVLAHLEKLDPTIRAWILEHAYARVLVRPRFSVAEKERIAIACLAATRCWKQWESHHKIARRNGVLVEQLLQDLGAIREWIGTDAHREAKRILTALPR